MRRGWARFLGVVLGLVLVGAVCPATAQTAAASQAAASPQADALARDFFALLEQGDASKFLSYVPEPGINVGPQASHLTRAEVEQQLLHHSGLYCKLFDSSCMQGEVKLDDSSRACSYRELLTRSEKVRKAATEAVRSGVRQAILVAEVKNDQCGGTRLIDFIFNYEPGGWKLFSVP
jgi:hypothetical protein